MIMITVVARRYIDKLDDTVHVDLMTNEKMKAIVESVRDSKERGLVLIESMTVLSKQNNMSVFFINGNLGNAIDNFIESVEKRHYKVEGIIGGFEKDMGTYDNLVYEIEDPNDDF